MGGWTGVGKDRINWNGQIEQKELTPIKDNDLITKKHLDDEIGAIPPSTPAGNNTEIQFNDSGSFGASSNLTWDGTALTSTTFNATANADVLQVDGTTVLSESSGDLTFELPTVSWELKEIDFFGGFFKLPELVAHSVLNVGSIKNSLYIRGATIDPNLIFSNAIGTDTAEIKYLRTPDVLNFLNAAEYSFDDKVTVNNKGCMTAMGGFAIKMTNKTGGNTVAGQIIRVYTLTAINDAFTTCALNDTNPIGIVLDAGVSDGSEAWVVVSGIADVLMDAGGASRGDRIITSGNTGGSGDVWNVGGAVATHFQEIGHCIESRGGTAGLARCVLHFL